MHVTAVVGLRAVILIDFGCLFDQFDPPELKWMNASNASQQPPCVPLT